MSEPHHHLIGTSSASRLVSIDAFRGLTILLMVFVNELGGMKGVPGWLKHYPAAEDGMTFVDVVFPAFLFVMGMAVPFALGRRLARGDSPWLISRHVLGRTLALLVMGVFMVNMPAIDVAGTGMSRAAWSLLAYLGFILIWNDYRPVSRSARGVAIGLRVAGVLLLVVLAVMFRGKAGDEIVGMRTYWWGILGLIGWAYLFGSAAYWVSGGRLAVVTGLLALCIALFIGDKTGALGFLGVVHEYINIGGHVGGHTAVALAGMTVALVLVRRQAAGPAGTVRVVLLIGLMFAAGGFLLRQAYGVNKNDATPSWCLYSAAWCCVVFALSHWLIEGRHLTRWCALVRPAGMNPLLAYILPSMVHALLAVIGVELLKTHLNEGWVGIVRSAVFAAGIVAVTGLLGRLGVRLRV